jgi:murein DD-endopeptidase MepM/ murein hydrolase activator NlpD
LPVAAQNVPAKLNRDRPAVARAANSINAARNKAGAELPVFPLMDEHDRPLRPIATVAGDGALYFLSPDGLWMVPDGISKLVQPQILKALRVGPGGAAVGSVPIQEFTALSYLYESHSVVVLDKSGDLFEYLPARREWRVFRANQPVGSPDPEYIDLASLGARICVLDPERNEIWRLPERKGQRSAYFVQVMPWRIKPGDANVSDGISIAHDGDTFVLRRHGQITKYSGGASNGLAMRKPFNWKPVAKMRPSRLIAAAGTPLFVVERENNRVIAVDRASGRARQYLFDQQSDLRGLIPHSRCFLVIDRDRLMLRMLDKDDAWSKAPLPVRRMDSRLDGIAYPLSSVVLPRHPGVWPGARRLYRYGIHKGVDFFCDAGKVTMGTPVKAADAGKVIRSDVNFRDMDSATYSRVMNQCRAEHRTSERNEDLFRGCQVWIDHGNGLVTRYAHLNGIRKGIKVGSYVSRGDTIAFVGVSGTGQNLPGVAKHPHLHFEIWLDGKYLGWGLTQSEILGAYEDIFGVVGERGGS